MPSMIVEGENTISCPLCCAPMSDAELKLFPCECSFQMCSFCIDYILSDSSECPMCGKHISRDTFRTDESQLERWKQLLAENRQQNSHQQQTRQSQNQAQAQLQQARILVPNTISVTNFPEDLARDEKTLKGPLFFGQYAPVTAITILGRGQERGTVQLLVRYKTQDDATEAVQSVHGSWIGGCQLSAGYAFKRYCQHFIEGRQCHNPDCQRLHQIQSNYIDYNRMERVVPPQNRETYSSQKDQTARLPPPISEQMQQTPSQKPTIAPWAKPDTQAVPAPVVQVRIAEPQEPEPPLLTPLQGSLDDFISRFAAQSTRARRALAGSIWELSQEPHRGTYSTPWFQIPDSWSGQVSAPALLFEIP